MAGRRERERQQSFPILDTLFKRFSGRLIYQRCQGLFGNKQAWSQKETVINAYWSPIPSPCLMTIQYHQAISNKQTNSGISVKRFYLLLYSIALRTLSLLIRIQKIRMASVKRLYLLHYSIDTQNPVTLTHSRSKPIDTNLYNIIVNTMYDINQPPTHI